MGLHCAQTGRLTGDKKCRSGRLTGDKKMSGVCASLSVVAGIPGCFLK